MAAFVRSLETVKRTNGHLFVHKLQILTEQIKEDSDCASQFKEGRGVDFLIETLLSEQSVFKTLSQVLNLIDKLIHSPFCRI
jgi:hypothetical protein